MIEQWTSAIGSAALRGGIAIAVAWMLSAVPNVPAAVRCWIWRAAYLAVIVSFCWTSPLVSRALSTPAAPQRTIEPVDPAASAADGLKISQFAGNTRQPTATNFASIRFIWPQVAFDCWLAFVVTYLASIVVRWRRAQRFRSGPSIQLAEITELADRIGVSPPPVRTHSIVPGPLLLGMWRPVIVLPGDAAAVGGPSTDTCS